MTPRSDSSARRHINPGAALLYQLKVTLAEVEPPIWRLIRVAGSVTLDRLHTVIQKAMGWQDAHLHEFEVRGRRYGVPEPDEPEYKVEPEWRMSLREAAPIEGTTFRYVYDLGDNWTHEVLVERIESPGEPLRHPVCLAGERRCPPEDCGGPGGYAEFLEIIRDPTHPEHKERLRWAGGRFDHEDFDLPAVSRKLRLLK